MDVRCERCKTEYEFDDARITEAGVTVKCTTCEHVFMVKKKALVVTVPVEPGDAGRPSCPGSPHADGGGARAGVEGAPGRAGTSSHFKELTTLQKWIVERKVTRDDEICLTGESWKRLGNIAELASFFQVVEEAQQGGSGAAAPQLGHGPWRWRPHRPRHPSGTAARAPPRAPPPPRRSTRPSLRAERQGSRLPVILVALLALLRGGAAGYYYLVVHASAGG